MSADAVGYVYRHSPYSGATFAIHLGIADTVNDTHGNRFYMATDNLAKKTRMSRRTAQRALDQLEQDLFIVKIVEANQHSPATYQFLFPENVVIFETRPGVTSVQSGVTSETSGVTSETARGDTTTPKPNTTQKKPKELSAENKAAFEEWWTLYPKKLKKEDARKAWKTATKKTTPADIIKATRYQLDRPESQLSREHQYIPYPATWLRAGSYDDTYTTQPARETRPYDQPTNTCTTCDGTRYTSHQDQQDRWYSTPCPNCQ